MLFSSIPFLYYFLPLVILSYILVPFKFKNGILLFFSLVFYGWGEPRYLIFMVISIISGYILGILIEKYQDKLYVFQDIKDMYFFDILVLNK